MPAVLTKPLIVPEYNNALIKLYTPDTGTGAPTVNAAYTINLQNVLDALFPGQGRQARPNACRLHGADLFVANSSGNSQAVLKFPGYLSDPANAVAHAFVFTLDGNDYVGLAFDKAGNLYTAEGGYLNNQIVRYGGANAAYPGAGSAAGDNHASRTVIGNAGATAYFGDLVFDAAGNLWAADYYNHRVVAFDAAGLGGANSWHAIGNTGASAVANTDPALNAATAHLFAEPEGLDFDGFGVGAALWVANNNDGGGQGGVTNALTSLVRITQSLQALILATPSGATVAAGIQPNVNCFVIQVPNGAAGRPQLGGLQIDKACGRLYVNEEVAGDARVYDLASIAATPASPAASLLGVATTNPGNGGIALIELGPYITDGNPDRGFEPDKTGTVAYESVAISVVKTDLGPQTTLPPNVDVIGGTGAYVYVRVDNFGPAATAGIETVDLRWAKASSGLGWPQPWNGSVFDVPPYQTSTMGGTVATGVAIPSIAALASVVIGPLPWTTPNPAQYSVQDGHFCLLGRIVTPGFGAEGMSFPEGGDLLTNVLNNARIAWRNIHIVNPVTNQFRPRATILAANYAGTPVTMRLGFEMLDGGGRVVLAPPGHIAIGARGQALVALRRAAPESVLRAARFYRGDTGHAVFILPDLAAGIDGIRLGAGETLALHADFLPARPHLRRVDRPEEILREIEELLEDFAEGRFVPPTPTGHALRVSQYAKEPGGDRLVGGQTFVFGHVEGFGLAH